MLSPFICGSSFHNQEDEDDSPCSTPRKSRKRSSKEKNPYATRGLDKFSALLADLDEKRQKIYSQFGSQDISLVRFVFSSSNDCVPIIVKLKDQNRASVDKDDQIKDKTIIDNAQTKEKSQAEGNQEDKQTRLESEKKKEKKKVTWELKLHKLRRPSYYMPVFMILILLFLAFFGRSVAILCTSIGWYVVPTLSSKRPPKPAKKKQLMRRYSEIGTRSKNINGDVKDKNNHGRQNSF